MVISVTDAVTLARKRPHQVRCGILKSRSSMLDHSSSTHTKSLQVLGARTQCTHHLRCPPFCTAPALHTMEPHLAASTSHQEACSSSSLATPSGSSVIAEKYARGEWVLSRAPRGLPPTNRKVARAVQQQVADSVETYDSYRRVAWCTAFVALYLLSLHSQVGWCARWVCWRGRSCTRCLPHAIGAHSCPARPSPTTSHHSGCILPDW
jgi:hypothetical protein